MKTTCMLALTMLVAAAGANAADKDKTGTDKTATSDQKEHKAKAADDPNKVICHTDPATGSHVHINRECHTRAQWAEIEEQTRKGMSDLTRGAGQTGADKGPFSPN